MQAVIEDSLAILLNQKVEILGAGRTDAGVHATQQMAHLDWPEAQPDPTHAWLRQLNAILPRDISVVALYAAQPPTLHARYDALRRSYRYQIARAKQPLLRHHSLHYDHPLDAQAMQAAAVHLLTVTDFAAFMKTGGNSKTSICQLVHSQWQFDAAVWTYAVQANRFLRGMVRALVGAQLAVGRGTLSLDEFRQKVAARDRTQMPANVAAKGLIFCGVEYSAHSLIKIAQLAPENLLP